MDETTVSLMLFCNYWRSCFLVPGCHQSPHVFTGHQTQCHDVPIKIFLLYGQKSGHLRQSNNPPPLRSPEVGELLSHFEKCKYLYSDFSVSICQNGTIYFCVMQLLIFRFLSKYLSKWHNIFLCKHMKNGIGGNNCVKRHIIVNCLHL